MKEIQMKLYGIKNCDTVVKARKYLENAGCAFDFYDVRTDEGKLNDAQLNAWMDFLGDDWVKLVNKRSTTWKAMSEMQKKSLTRDSAVGLILANPTLMKRPVLQKNDAILVGFMADQYQDFI